MSAVDEQDSLDDIAIIGMIGRFPGAHDIDAFWRNISAGIESISFFSDAELEASGVSRARFEREHYVKAGGIIDDVELFDAPFFKINPREAAVMDPQQRIFLECAWTLLEQAGYDPETCPGRVGVYAGVNISTYLLHNLVPHHGLLETINGAMIKHGNDKDYIATRVSYKLNLRGPSVSVQTGCSTSLVAVHFACQSLLNGECDMVLAGGVNIETPQKKGYFYQEGDIRSPDGHCRAFDAHAQGTLFTNGVGIVLLKRLADARADRDCIHAVIKGSAINNDGASKVGYTAPSVQGQSEVIAEALLMANIAPDTISYVEAHGTGTALGDPIEIAALTQAFRSSTHKSGFCAIGSVKTNIGHLNVAAGVAGLIKTVMALKQRVLPPSLHFEQPNPAINFQDSPFYVNTAATPWNTAPLPRRAGVSSFGMGGTNAHVILEEAPPPLLSGPSRTRQLLVLSAKTPTALEAATLKLAKHLHQHPEIDLADTAYTLQVGRGAYTYRRALVCRNREDAVAILAARDPRRIKTNSCDTRDRPIAFMFSGQGAQYLHMGWDLYQSEPAFRRSIDDCTELLIPHLGLDIRDVIYPHDQRSNADEQLNQTQYAQPALFAVEYALAMLWQEWGVYPDVLIGHSLGELVAACLANVFSLEDALMIVAARGRLIQELPSGSMLSVMLPAGDLQRRLPATLSIAAINAPNLCVASGPAEEIAHLERDLVAQGISCRGLRVSHAFHSQMLEPALEPLLAQFQRISLNSPTIPFVSNVTGTWITPAEATDPAYWAAHIRQTVLFAQGLAAILEVPDRLIIEIGPGRALSTLALRHSAKTDRHTILSVLPPRDASETELDTVLHALSHAWLAGVSVDWAGFNTHQQRSRIQLPTYQFDRQRYWIDPPARQVQQLAQPLDPLEARATDTSPLATYARFQQPDSYIAPRDALEQTIAELWQSLLGIEQVGANDNFFELGGHSLLAIQLSTQLQARFGVPVGMRGLLETATVAGQAQAVALALRETTDSASVPATIDWQAECALAPEISPPTPFVACEERHILLSGATGFLGAFLLHQLLRQSRANIYCLVRGADAAEALIRIQHNLEHYALPIADCMERVIPIVGDLARPLLGLTADVFDDLAQHIDVIYHNGAMVNFVYPYTALKDANVGGTHEILRLACRTKTKPVHHISTTATLSGAAFAAESTIFEQDQPGQLNDRGSGYAQSKRVAEKLIQAARERGLPACIYRPSNIIGDSRTGASHSSDLLWLIIKGCIQLGAAPDFDRPIDITPVDFVSRAIVYLSRRPDSLGKNFHLVHPEPPSWSDIFDWVRDFGYPLDPLPYAEWHTALADPGGADNLLASLVPLLPERLNNQREQRRFAMQNTLAGLDGSSISCPSVDANTFAFHLAYFIRTQFLDAPTSQRAAALG